MSAIRVNLPGSPVRLIDLGPSSPLSSSVGGGRLAIGAPTNAAAEKARAYKQANRERDRLQQQARRARKRAEAA